MVDLALLTKVTAQMLARFLDPVQAPQRPAFVASLRPRREDYARVFLGDAVARAREGYERIWESTIPSVAPRAGQTSLALFLAVGRDFVEESPRAKRFPGGYARIARLLAPDQVWAAWKFVPPGQSIGMAYDGLVCLEDRWAWFPKPWKVILPSASTAGPWTD